MLAARLTVTPIQPGGRGPAWLFEAGWTPQRYTAVRDLFEWALPGSCDDYYAPNEVLLGAAERSTENKRDWDVIWAWLELLATTPLSLLGETLRLRAEHSVGEANLIEVLINLWAGVPTEVAVLAFAAGLTPAEFGEKTAGGAVDTELLRVMAGLRGYRFR